MADSKRSVTPLMFEDVKDDDDVNGVSAFATLAEIPDNIEEHVANVFPFLATQTLDERSRRICDLQNAFNYVTQGLDDRTANQFRGESYEYEHINTAGPRPEDDTKSFYAKQHQKLKDYAKAHQGRLQEIKCAEQLCLLLRAWFHPVEFFREHKAPEWLTYANFIFPYWIRCHTPCKEAIREEIRAFCDTQHVDIRAQACIRLTKPEADIYQLACIIRASRRTCYTSFLELLASQV